MTTAIKFCLAFLFAVTLFADEAPKPLSAEDQEAVSRAAIRALSARADVLQDLIDDRLGVARQKALDQATAAYRAQIDAMHKKYNAAPECDIAVIEKTWNCPVKEKK